MSIYVAVYVVNFLLDDSGSVFDASYAQPSVGVKPG